MRPLMQWMMALAISASGGLAAAAEVNTLRGAVEQAVLQNPEVLARYHAMTAASEEVSVARGARLPRFDVAGHVGSETLEQRETTPAPPSDYDRYDTYNIGGASATLRQLLFDGGATRREVARLKYAKRVRYYELQATAEDIALQTTKAYIDVLRYRKLVDLAKDNYANHKEVFEHVKQRVQAGIARGVDLEQAAGRLALAEANMVTEGANLHDVSARFQRLVGVEPPDPLEELPSFEGKLPPAEELMEGAFRRAPQMNAALENIRASRAELKSKGGSFWPTLALQGSTGYERNIDNRIDRETRGRLELMLNWNLFSGGTDRARVRQYHEKVYEAFDNRDKVCRDLRQNTRIAWNDTRKLAEQRDLQDQQQLATAKARDAYRKQFDLGQRTLLDLLDTENELYDARRTYLNTSSDYELAHARVLAPTGHLLENLALKSAGSDAVDSDDDPIGDDDRVKCGMDDPSKYAIAKPADRPVTPLPKRRRLESFTLKADTLFAFDKADLSAKGKTALDGLVDGLKAHAAHKDRTINVHGYTDRLGSDDYNLRLSDRRANTVREYLISKGLPFNQVTAKGHGEADPVTGATCVGDKPTPNLIACLQPDRRVVIDVDGQEEVTIQFDPEAGKWERAPAAGGTAPAPDSAAPAPGMAPAAP